MFWGRSCFPAVLSQQASMFLFVVTMGTPDLGGSPIKNCDVSSRYALVSNDTIVASSTKFDDENREVSNKKK